MHIDAIVGIQLKPALERAGCPICNISHAFETRYLANLLHEYVNDYETRMHLIASLGYCAKHAWQMVLMEMEKYGDAVGNAIIYENLVKVALKPLAGQKLASKRRSLPFTGRMVARLKRLLGLPAQKTAEPFEALIHSSCRVCLVGKNAEKNYTEWLLKSLSEPEPELREAYRSSDGLCLAHFRNALTIHSPEVESGMDFIVDTLLDALPRLRENLREYADKHAWDRRAESMTAEESRSYLRAIRFFAGNEENTFLEMFDEFPVDDRENQLLEGKYG